MNKKVDWKKYDGKYLRLTLKFNKDEVLILKEHYKGKKIIKLTTFVKNVVLFGGVDYQKQLDTYNLLIDSNKNINLNLKKLGNNINQIALRINQNKELSRGEVEFFKAELSRIAALINQSLLKK